MTTIVPLIENHTQIGALPDNIPITFGDLANMTYYNAPRMLSVRDKSEPKTTGMTIVTDDGIIPDGWTDLSTPSCAIKCTVGSVDLNNLVIDYFHKNVWERVKDKNPEEDKWKHFGLFMTTYAQKCLGTLAWNQNSIVYWKTVSMTLQC